MKQVHYQTAGLLRHVAQGMGLVLVAAMVAACTYSIPKDLPVRDLNLPADAKLTTRPTFHAYKPKLNESSATRHWGIWFDSSSSWEQVVYLLEKGLAPQEYVEILVTDSTGHKFGNESHSYYSKDGLISISIINIAEVDVELDMGAEYDSDYLIGVYELTWPREKFEIAMEKTDKHWFEYEEKFYRLRYLNKSPADEQAVQ